MPLDINYDKRNNLLKVKYTQPGYPDELIEMEAHSGGWDAHRSLPKGKWLIVENPSGDKSYFGLFYKDSKINDQFKHGVQWRDGIRLGFHSIIGSHGCVMTRPAAGQSYLDALSKWERIQQLIRTKRPIKVIRYQNDENPRRRDNTTYTISSYGDLTVLD